VNPGRPIPPASTAIHGITDAMVASAPRGGEVLPRFLQFMGEAVLVADHVAFDLAVLSAEARAAGLPDPVPGLVTLDTRLLSRVAAPQERHHQLEAVAERVGVVIRGRHTALGDARAAAEIYARLVPRLAAAGVRTLGDAQAAVRQVAPRTATGRRR
jgi:DNA polymerase-3 subunit epsilon